MKREEIRNNAATNYGYAVAGGCIERGYIQDAFEKGAMWADAHPKNPWHKASEELPKDRVFLAHCIGMSRGFIDRILWNARNGGFDNLNDTFPSASIKESHFEDYYDYWMDIPELKKNESNGTAML